MPVTSKPAEVRMGKGKGAVDYWAARVHPGRIMFEIDGVPDDIARQALALGSAKLPIRTKVVTRLAAGDAKGGFQLNFGAYGLKAMEPERVTARQIEACRRAITRQMKRQGRVWIRIFPDLPVTDKPAEVRMGKGKGAVDYWAARVAPGRIMFEIDGVPDDVAREALRLGAAKLPIRVKVVTRADHGGVMSTEAA